MITIKTVFASTEISITLFLSSGSFHFQEGAENITLSKWNSNLRNSITVSNGVYYSIRTEILKKKLF